MALVGDLPNSGKSQILASLTHALPLIADYSFTTRVPLPGMMKFENIQIHLVDTPPLMDEFAESGLLNLIRSVDALAPVLDLTEDGSAQIEHITEELNRRRIRILAQSEEPKAEIGRFQKRAVLIGNKCDLPEAQKNCQDLIHQFSPRFRVLCVSAKEGVNLDELRKEIFATLNIVRAYTKTPGKSADRNDPVVLPNGSNVLPLASQIHKDFAHRLKYARIWRR